MVSISKIKISYSHYQIETNKLISRYNKESYIYAMSYSIKDTQLYLLLATLEDRQWHAFKSYLGDPSLGASQSYVQFLTAFQQLKAGSIPDDTQAFSSFACKGKPWNHNSMKRHFSLLQGKLLDFLAIRRILEDPGYGNLVRTQTLVHLGWAKQAQQRLSRKQEQKDDSHLQSTTSLLEAAAMACHPNLLNDPPSTSNGQHWLGFAIDSLDQAYLITALDLACRSMNEHLFKHRPLHLPILVRNRHTPTSNGSATTPATQLFTHIYSIYQAYVSPEGTQAVTSLVGHQFSEAMIVLRSAGHWQPSMGHLLTTGIEHLISLAAHHLHSNPALMRPMLLELYTLLFAHAHPDSGQHLSPVHYYNTAHRISQSEAADSLQEVLLANKAKLPEPLQEPTYQLCLARHHFENRNFPEGWSAICKVRNEFGKPDLFELELSYRLYQVALATAISEYEYGQRLAQNFQAWLTRNRTNMAPDRYRAYRVFAAHSQRLTGWADGHRVRGLTNRTRAAIVALMGTWPEQMPVLRSWLSDFASHLLITGSRA